MRSPHGSGRQSCDRLHRPPFCQIPALRNERLMDAKPDAQTCVGNNEDGGWSLCCDLRHTIDAAANSALGFAAIKTYRLFVRCLTFIGIAP